MKFRKGDYVHIPHMGIDGEVICYPKNVYSDKLVDVKLIDGETIIVLREEQLVLLYPASEGFIKDCLFFRSKKRVDILLGVFVWLNLLQAVAGLLSLAHKLNP